MVGWSISARGNVSDRHQSSVVFAVLGERFLKFQKSFCNSRNPEISDFAMIPGRAGTVAPCPLKARRAWRLPARIG